MAESRKRTIQQSRESTIPPSTKINSLPIEILSHIFWSLKLEERKSARLVCRNWYDELNRSIFRKKEKFVCRGFEGFENVSNTLSGFDFPIFNLEFQLFYDRDQSTNLIRPILDKHGNTIEQLSFWNCTVSPTFINQIIVQCVNLRYLNIDSLPENILDSMIEQKVIRKNLLTIKTFYYGRTWADKLVIVFPNLEEFLFTSTMFTRTMYRTNASHLNHRKFMKKTFHIEFNNNVWGFFNFSTNYPTLQDLKFVGLRQNSLKIPLLRFLNAQHQLRKISITWNFQRGQPSFPYAMILLRTLLSKFPNLVSIDLELDLKSDVAPVFIYDDTWNMLLDSKLECFKLLINYEILLQNNLVDLENVDKIKKNYTLKRLGLAQVNSDQLLFWVTSFPMIECLEVEGIVKTQEFIPSIVQYLPRLTTFQFKISDINKPTTNSAEFDSEKVKLHLANLRSVYLKSAPVDEDWIYNSCMDIFPFMNNVEYLNIQINKSSKVKQTNLLMAIYKLTKLKALAVGGLQYPFTYSMRASLSSSLRDLMFLRIQDNASMTFTHDEIENTFRQSKSLRAFNYSILFNNIFNWAFGSYYYNRHRKISFSLPIIANLYRIHNQELDQLNVYWIKF